MHISDCHFSNNSKSWIHRRTYPIVGATKSVTNATFVGFTHDTDDLLRVENLSGLSDSGSKLSESLNRTVPFISLCFDDKVGQGNNILLLYHLLSPKCLCKPSACLNELQRFTGSTIS